MFHSALSIPEIVSILCKALLKVKCIRNMVSMLEVS